MSTTNWGIKDDVEPISAWDKRIEGDAPAEAHGVAENPVTNQGGFTLTSGFQLYDDKYFHFGSDKDWKIGFQTATGGRLLILLDESTGSTNSVFEISVPSGALFSLYELGFMRVPTAQSALNNYLYPPGTITYDSSEKALLLYTD